MADRYTWTDNPTVSGAKICDTDILNDCLMHLKYDHEEIADTDLSNLTSFGNSKFQYAPFSINSGDIDASGNNSTLHLPEGSSSEITEAWTQPVLSANGTLGGDSFACAASSVGTVVSSSGNNQPYWSFNNYSNGGNGDSWVSAGVSASSPQWIEFYNPVPLRVTELSLQYFGNGSGYNTGKLQGSNDDNGWTDICEITNGAFTGLENNTGAYKYHRLIFTYSGFGRMYINKINITAVQVISIASSSTLICAPCTITTADGRTKTFEDSSVLDCSGFADRTYKILKSYSDGSLTIRVVVPVSKTAYASPGSGTVWLDNSMYPLALKMYNGSEWEINNDLVYIGDVTVSKGVITAVKNNPFNWNGVSGSSAGMPSDRYIELTKGASGSTYTAPADGWFGLYILTRAANSGCCMENITTGFFSAYPRGAGANTGISCILPARKNDVISISYDGSIQKFNFYYSQGGK